MTPYVMTRVVRSDGEVLIEQRLEKEDEIELLGDRARDLADAARDAGYHWKLQVLDPDGELTPTDQWMTVLQSDVTPFIPYAHAEVAEGIFEWHCGCRTILHAGNLDVIACRPAHDEALEVFVRGNLMLSDGPGPIVEYRYPGRN